MSSFDQPPLQPPIEPGPLGGNQLPPRRVPPYTFEGAFSAGIASFKEQYGMLLLFSLLLIIASIVGDIPGNLAGMVDPITGLVVDIAMTYLVFNPLAAGLMFAGVRAARGERIKGDDAGLGFQRWPAVVVAYIVAGLAMLATCIPAGLAVGMGYVLYNQRGGTGDPSVLEIVIGAVGVVITIVLALWVYSRTIFAPYVAVDPRWSSPSGIECVSTSWRLTEKSYSSVLGLALVAGLIALVSLILCVLPILFVGIPLVITMLGAAYAQHCAPFFESYCPRCGYDLTGAPGPICPECGTAAGAGAPPALA